MLKNSLIPGLVFLQLNETYVFFCFMYVDFAALSAFLADL